VLVLNAAVDVLGHDRWRRCAGLKRYEVGHIRPRKPQVADKEQRNHHQILNTWLRPRPVPLAPRVNRWLTWDS